MDGTCRGTQAILNYGAKVFVELDALSNASLFDGDRHGGTRSAERIKNSLTGKAEHSDQATGKLAGKHGMVPALSLPGYGPVRREVLAPFFDRHGAERFLIGRAARSLSGLLEHQDELVVNFQNAVAGVRVGPHQCAPAACVCIGHLLPDDGAHVVGAEGRHLSDDIAAYGQDSVSPMIFGPQKLIADIDAHPATRQQAVVAVVPDLVEIVEVRFV